MYVRFQGVHVLDRQADWNEQCAYTCTYVCPCQCVRYSTGATYMYESYVHMTCSTGSGRRSSTCHQQTPKKHQTRCRPRQILGQPHHLVLPFGLVVHVQYNSSSSISQLNETRFYSFTVKLTCIQFLQSAKGNGGWLLSKCVHCVPHVGLHV